MIIYVKYAKNTYPSNFVIERTDKPLIGFETLEIESLELFLNEQNQILNDFVSQQSQIVIIEQDPEQIDP